MSLGYFIIFGLIQLVVTLIGMYIFELVKESGKLAALSNKENSDFKKSEKRELGMLILEYLNRLDDLITSEDWARMGKAQSRLTVYNKDLSDMWIEYNSRTFYRGLQIKEGTWNADKKLYRKNVDRIIELRKLLEEGANQLIDDY